jgi:hypothetical protein
LSIALLSLCPGDAHATSFAATWVGTAGDWTDPTNWSSDPVYPDNVGGASYKAVINSSNAFVNLDSTITVGQVLLNSGTLTGAGTLNVTETAVWAQVALNGTGTINVTGADLEILGAGRRFSNFAINASAATTTTWSSGLTRSTSLEGGTFNNSGTFDDQTDATWTWEVIQTSVFNNLSGAVFKKTDGSGVQEMQPEFNNGGTVDVQTAGLLLSGGGTSSGTFTVAPGAQLSISDFNQDFADAGSPVTTFLAGSVINSSGTLAFANNFGDSHSEIHGKVDAVFMRVDPGLTGMVNFHSGASIGQTFVGDVEVTSGTLGFESGASGAFNNAGVAFGGAISIAGGSVSVGALNLHDGGKVFLVPSSSALARATSLSIDGGTGSKIDLTDGKAIVDYTGATPAPGIRALLITGRNSGSWDGEGIQSSSAAIVASSSEIHKTAIGYAEASELHISSFAGQSIDGSAILMRYTYLGDANLDGKVNALDFNALAASFGTGNSWCKGDFNYDGVTNMLDFAALATNFNLALASPGLGAIVPEPVGAIFAAAAVLIIPRRREL